MHKTVLIGEEGIGKLKEALRADSDAVSHNPVEADEYTLGTEKGPAPVGGSQFHIGESLIKEGLSSNLYHFTSISAGYEICKDDVIYFQSAFAKESDNFDKKRKFYLSCTRQYNSKFGFSSKFGKGGVRLCLDGDAIAHRFAGKQINYWGGGGLNDKYSYYKNLPKDEGEFRNKVSYYVSNFKKKHPDATEDDINKFIMKHYNDDAQRHIDNESEDRVFSYEPVLRDAHQYIKSVDVLIPGVLEDKEKMSSAAAFLYGTILGRHGKYVRIFDSEEQFAHPKGKPVNEKIEYQNGPSMYVKNGECIYELSKVISFITIDDENYNKKNFGQQVSELLKRYGLEKYIGKIGEIQRACQNTFSIQSAADSVDAIRRSLSDEPSEDKSKVSKMLTDYCLSIGANSFRDAYLIKKARKERKYSKVYDRIDTSVKLPYLIINGYTISVNPDKDKFRDAVDWNDEWCKCNAEVFADEVKWNSYEGQYNSGGSKNTQSLFHYIYKLFRKGTVSEVRDALSKIGFTDEFIESFRVSFEVKELDYWDASRLNTVSSSVAERNGANYSDASKIKDEEIERYVEAMTGGKNAAVHESVGSKKLLKEWNERLDTIDMSTVGEVEYSCDFDEDEYNEWLSDEEEADTPEKKLEYFKSNVSYDLELFDNETLHHMCYSDGYYEDLCNAFGRNIADKIVKDSMNGESGRFEAYEMYEDDAVNINDPESVTAYAEKMYQHGGYSKDCRGFILHNGTVIYTPAEHNAVTMIPGVNSKFDFIRLGNIRVLDHSIDIGKEPTKEQYAVLSQIASAYAGDELYLDILTQGGGEIGAKYENVRPSYVIGEIKRYYAEGIKPQGSAVYEGKINEEAVPTQYDDEINRLSDEISAFRDSMSQKYNNKFWFSRAIFPDLKVDDADIEKRKTLYDEYNKLKKLRDVEYRKKEEQEQLQRTKEYLRKSQEEQEVIDLAVEEYGTTSYLGDAGYILPDGRLLNFSRSGDANDHRQIASVYKNNGIKIWNDDYRYNYVVDFMNRGAIRCDVNVGLLDMTREPSNEQYNVLKRFVRSAGDVDIDFTNDVGDTEHSVSYSNVSPQRVVADIQRYYREGIKPQGNVQYEGKKEKKVMKENVEDEVKASDVDLSSFEPKSKLEPNIWKDGKLDSKIRLKLLDIADDFWDYVGITWAEPVGIHLTGSICGFNYSDFSDIDLHIVADFSEIDERKDFVRRYMDEKKNGWKTSHKGLKIMGYEVELYVEDVNDSTTSDGVYDLEENDWISKPNHPMEISADDEIKQKSADLMTIIDGMEVMLHNSDDSHVYDEIYDDAILMFKKLKDMRTSALSSDGESGVGNIVYKSLRRGGYLDRLGDILNTAYDKKNSINESAGLLKEYLDKNYNLPLYQYFKWANNASECEKARDFAYHCPWAIETYIDKISPDYPKVKRLLTDGSFDEYDDENIDKFIEFLEKNKLCEHFISIMQNITDYTDWPAWLTMSYNNVVKNEWCIHFCKDANSVAREGFTGGTPEIDSLAYTGAGQEKGMAGYNFAFRVYDNSVDFNNYGNEAVIFRTSGVEILHYGDEQNQVVFWGPYAHDFIPIYQEHGEWVVYNNKGQILKSAERPSDIVEWAMDNFQQYRRQIMTTKANPKLGYNGIRTDEIHKLVKKMINEGLLKEYFTTDESELYDYFKRWENASDVDKVEDIYDETPYALREYISKYHPLEAENIDIYNEYEILTFIEENDLESDFIEKLPHCAEYVDLPSWYFFSLSNAPIVKNEWLVHFSDWADNIFKNGFIYGNRYAEKLGLTTADYDTPKDGNYLFAFRVSDRANIDPERYGDGCVVFRASGVEVYHNGDKERQVIFDRRTASNFIYIRRSNDADYHYEACDKKTGRVLYKADFCIDVIDWVIDNYDQYRKRISNRPVQMKESVSPIGFDEWYGNSVLRDEDGNPIKMYHGATDKFDKFDKSFIGSSGSGSYEGYGFNFTPFQGRALGYSGKDGEVWETYLKAEHPLANDKKTITPQKLMEIIKKLDEGLPVTDRMVPAYESPRYGEKWDEAYYRRALPKAAKFLYDNTNSDADLYAEICAGGASDKYKTIQVFEDMGYDSCILKDDSGRLFTVVVFEPEQIMRCRDFENDSINESIEENFIGDEIVADGNSSHNPYAKRWKAEREALKNFLVHFGKTMTSKENGKQYKVYFDKTLSDLIGYNYCICVQWDPVEMIPSPTPYIRAYDKFTERIFQAQYDTRGLDNVQGTADDVI